MDVAAVSERDALQGFLGKWQAQWPEWRVAEVFVPEAHRARAQAWFALRDELGDAAWGGDDPRPGDAKLGWWAEELDGWSRGARRHPLGLSLQKVPAPWDSLAACLPALPLPRRMWAGGEVSFLSDFTPEDHVVRCDVDAAFPGHLQQAALYRSGHDARLLPARHSGRVAVEGACQLAHAAKHVDGQLDRGSVIVQSVVHPSMMTQAQHLVNP